jgi:hypothetical protein
MCAFPDCCHNGFLLQRFQCIARDLSDSYVSESNHVIRHRKRCLEFFSRRNVVCPEVTHPNSIPVPIEEFDQDNQSVDGIRAGILGQLGKSLIIDSRKAANLEAIPDWRLGFRCVTSKTDRHRKTQNLPRSFSHLAFASAARFVAIFHARSRFPFCLPSRRDFRGALIFFSQFIWFGYRQSLLLRQ